MLTKDKLDFFPKIFELQVDAISNNFNNLISFFQMRISKVNFIHTYKLLGFQWRWNDPQDNTSENLILIQIFSIHKPLVGIILLYGPIISNWKFEGHIFNFNVTGV